ncbi:hypothetical protein [Kitasatospora sp. NPDC001095]
MSTFKPGPKLCKLLYGRAQYCAYETTCRQPLVTEHRGRLSLNSQIAHIRAENAGGPRHVPGYDDVNGEENLLLLCFPHHKQVDDHPDAYTIEELLAWKKAQIAQLGERHTLVLTDDQVQQIVAALTTPVAGIDLLGILLDERGMTQVPVEALAGTRFLNRPELGRFLGVRVTNAGALPFDVDAVGIDLDIDWDAPASYQFVAGNPVVCPPSRLLPQANSVWLADIPTVGGSIKEIMVQTLRVPTQVRAYAHLGGGSRTVGPWLSTVNLPVWNEDMTQERLEELVRLAEERRRGGASGRQLGEPE